MARLRRRINLTLSPDLLERTERLVARLPGASISKLVEESLGAMLPTMELAAEAMEKHGKDTKEARDAFAAEIVRTLLVAELEKEEAR